MGGRRGSERLWRISGWGSTKFYVLFFVDHDIGANARCLERVLPSRFGHGGLRGLGGITGFNKDLILCCCCYKRKFLSIRVENLPADQRRKPDLVDFERAAAAEVFRLCIEQVTTVGGGIHPVFDQVAREAGIGVGEDRWAVGREAELAGGIERVDG